MLREWRLFFILSGFVLVFNLGVYFGQSQVGERVAECSYSNYWR